MSKNKLYRIPQQGKLKGVCAGIADYLGIPVLLVRVIVVLSMFCGLFIFTLIAYFVLAAVLDEMPLSVQGQDKPLSAHQLLDELSAELCAAASVSCNTINRSLTEKYHAPMATTCPGPEKGR